jgi:hypothetical protein
MVLAGAAARDTKRGEGHQYLDAARKIAGRLGQDRDDCGTELGRPTSPSMPSTSLSS